MRKTLLLLIEREQSPPLARGRREHVGKRATKGFSPFIVARRSGCRHAAAPTRSSSPPPPPPPPHAKTIPFASITSAASPFFSPPPLNGAIAVYILWRLPFSYSLFCLAAAAFSLPPSSSSSFPISFCLVWQMFGRAASYVFSLPTDSAAAGLLLLALLLSKAPLLSVLEDAT